MPGFRLHPLVVVSALQILLVVEGFQNHGLSSTNHHHSLQRRSKSPSSGRLLNSNTDGDNDDDGFSLPKSSSSPISSQLEAGTFNPLKYRASSSKPSSSSTSQVSLRSFRMTQVTTDLLNNIDDETATRTILEDNKDFLLEPLEEEDAVAGSDSIYAPGMSRAERYHAYRKSVDERLKSSRNEKAKAVLTAMRDFVLEFENEGESL